MRRLALAIALAVLASLPVSARFTTASDNFTRADNTTLGTNWIDPESEYGIGNGTFHNAATQINVGVNAQAVAWWNPSTNSFTGNQFSQVTCSVFSSQQCGLGVNMSGASLAAFTGYVLFVDSVGHAWSLYRQDAGISYNPLNTGSVTPADGDIFYLENNAGTLTAKRNGSVLGTGSDGTYTGGQPGLNVYSNGSVNVLQLNTWSGGDLGGGGATFQAGVLNNPILLCCKGPR